MVGRMSAARSMTGAVYQQGPRKPGWVYLGTGPKSGQPRDAQGRLILVQSYGPPEPRIAPESAQIEYLGISKVGRGVAAVPQDQLL